MALPFVAGLVAGGLAIAAFNNKKELKDVAKKGLDKTKEVAGDIKNAATSTAECVKEKMSKEEEKPKPAPRKRTTKPKTTTKKTTTKTTTKEEK